MLLILGIIGFSVWAFILIPWPPLGLILHSGIGYLTHNMPRTLPRLFLLMSASLLPAAVPFVIDVPQLTECCMELLVFY